MVVQRAADGSLNSIMQIDRDITERRQLERERERLMLESDRQRDRERIGMDLHDGIIQSIYAVTLGLEATAEDVVKDGEAAQEGLNAAIDQLSDIIRDIRSYIFELRPSRFSSDLSESLEEMVRDFGKGATMQVQAQIDHGLPALSEDARAMLFHIAREALTNARKHARASSVSLALRNHADVVRLEVHDDGIGFDTDASPLDEQHGLRNMRLRAAGIGAGLNIRSGGGKGTTIVVELPLGEREKATS
jgi:signal transduction histidine kinase